jgi:predicted AlkP superfamily phosphohydrolase/phosphomutase
MQESQLIIVSVDGLGPHDLGPLYDLMPKTAKHLAKLSYRNLNCVPLVSPQAVWAELLTGRPWFENGCAGFSKPNGSLQNLAVFTEDSLLVPVELLSKTKNVVINIPLLQPSHGDRDFLSDGSAPASKAVSPPELLMDELFQRYRPRPYASSIAAMAKPLEALKRCIETERIRLHCAMSLFRGSRPWQRFLYRLSLFDHLAHLFGPNVLSQTTLRGYDQLQSFLRDFDDNLCTVFESFPDADICFLSAFSHTAGKMRININRMLQRGGFLKLESDDEASAIRARDREMALAIALGVRRNVANINTTRQLIGSSQAQAVSPVAGCVFINDTDRFSDGAISTSEHDATKSKVVELLRARLALWAGESATVIPNPAPNANGSIAPDAIAYADGVEFYHVIDSNDDDDEAPRAVHAPLGFAFLSKRRLCEQAEAITPVELSKLLMP